MIRKRAEKETDPNKYPGQIINRPPSHFEKPLEKAIEEYKDDQCQCTPEQDCPLHDGRGG